MLLFSSTVFFKILSFSGILSEWQTNRVQKVLQTLSADTYNKFAASQDIVDGERSKVDLDFRYLSLVIYSHTCIL